MDLNNIEKLRKSLAIIIASTHRVKRPVDIITLIKNIRYAEKELKDLCIVAQRVKLSEQQLKDFLAAEKLCDEVKTLVKKRFIDSVDIVKNISKLTMEKQRILADHIRKGRITSKDVRIITTFAEKFPDKSIKKIIADYDKSKDVKVYVLQFRVPSDFKLIHLHKRLEAIIGKSEIKKSAIEREVVVLELTTDGYKKLREAVRRKQTTLRKFIMSLFEDIS